MKTIICLIGLVFTFSLGNAQTSSNSKVSISHSSNEPGNENYKINISISNTDDMYTLNAKFPKSKTQKLEKFLKTHLDVKMIKKETMTTWTYNTNDEIGYTVRLKKGRLNVYLSKETVSSDSLEEIMSVFSDIREVIKG